MSKEEHKRQKKLLRKKLKDKARQTAAKWWRENHPGWHPIKHGWRYVPQDKP